MLHMDYSDLQLDLFLQFFDASLNRRPFHRARHRVDEPLIEFHRRNDITGLLVTESNVVEQIAPRIERERFFEGQGRLTITPRFELRPSIIAGLDIFLVYRICIGVLSMGGKAAQRDRRCDQKNGLKISIQCLPFPAEPFETAPATGVCSNLFAPKAGQW